MLLAAVSTLLLQHFWLCRSGYDKSITFFLLAEVDSHVSTTFKGDILAFLLSDTLVKGMRDCELQSRPAGTIANAHCWCESELLCHFVPTRRETLFSEL